MKYRILASKINLLLAFAAVLFLISVNTVSIKKVASKAYDEKKFLALDDFTKRDIFMKMSETFIFNSGGKIDEKFKSCTENKQATKSFYKAVMDKTMSKTLDGIGKECYNSEFQLQALEPEMLRTLGIYTDASTISYASIDKIKDQREFQYPVDFKKINNPGN